METFKNTHSNFRLNNVHYTTEELKEVSYSLIKEGESFEKQIGQFLLDWLDDSLYIYLKTSGSTGQPKIIKMDKQAMVNSAVATGKFFKLSPGQSALLCLPAAYIAGKMMLVRAMVLGLDITLINPKTNLSINTKKIFDFCAMIPLQVEKNVNKLTNIKTLIVGGAPISNKLKKEVQSLKTHVYITYGMTETVSHIAIKKLNHIKKEAFYRVLPNVSIKKDTRNCLVINAPNLNPNKIVTNDLVEIHGNKSFEWLGRYDNVINSGGVKLIPEQIETKLQHEFTQRFFITSFPHKTLGEQVVLVIEGDKITVSDVKFKSLKKFEKPKEILFIKKFSETSSGKIQRNKTLSPFKKVLN